MRLTCVAVLLLAAPIACASAATTEGGPDASPRSDAGPSTAGDASSTSDARVTGPDAAGNCTAAPAQNDPGCPAAYSFSLNGQPCSPAGLRCAYPGAGDQQPDGCWGTAMLLCRATSDIGPAAAWVAAQ